MKTVLIPIIAVVATVAVVLSSPMSAQPKGSGMGKPTFAIIDLNGDGTITEEEFTDARAKRIEKRAKEGRQMKHLANAPSFADIDTDRSGGIDSDEFATYQAEHGKKRGERKGS